MHRALYIYKDIYILSVMFLILLYYRCGSCPIGFTGDGIVCFDINECELQQPCHPGVQCINLEPGYRCGQCPVGYTSPKVEGVGLTQARTHKQVCTDVNECLFKNGGCHPHAECINTPVKDLTSS